MNENFTIVQQGADFYLQKDQGAVPCHSSFLGKNFYYGKKYNANRNITNYLPSQSKEIPKKFDDINQKLTTSFTVSEVTSGDKTVKEVDTKPRLLFQTPKSAYESSLRSPLFHKTIISDARADIIDFILKCCTRLQLPMAIVAAVLKSYHKYHEYNSKRKINWHEQFIDESGFDEELLGISCILIEIENTKYFKGIRKAMNIGWRLKYPNIPLDGCDKLKKTVKIMMSNVKNAISREPFNKTPIKSASRVIRTLKDEFGPNALADPLFNNSDELATAVIYITSGSVGIDLKRDFDVFCVEFSGSDPLRIKDAILEIATMKQRNQFNGAELT
ncbi:20749_t:CDS:2 [Gigaspora rosea]|nr:20749_t:CDS:2 [Gigaspora rosea]